MLNPLEKLLDVYCNYNYDFTSTRKTFLTYKCTRIWGGLINPGCVISFLLAQLLVPGGLGGRGCPARGLLAVTHCRGTWSILQARAEGTCWVAAGPPTPRTRLGCGPGHARDLGPSRAVMLGLVWPQFRVFLTVEVSHGWPTKLSSFIPLRYVCAFISCALETYCIFRASSGLAST